MNNGGNKYRGRNFNNRKYDRRDNRYDNQEERKKRVKKLDMKRSEEFNFMLNKALTNVAESLRGSLAGSIYSMSSRHGINMAKEFVIKKKEEGLLNEENVRKIMNLLNEYSIYR
ncbi:hypothetical protein [Caldiplasma sukawensis]